MDGFWSSFSKWFSEKTGTPLYFTYVGFFVAWNWKIFQIVFLEDATLFRGPRIEYIYSQVYAHFFLNHFSTRFPTWLLLLSDNVQNILWRIIPPAILTLFSILYLPTIQKWALHKYLDSRFDRKRMFEEKQRQYDKWKLSSEEEKEETLERIATVKKRQVKKREEIQSATTQEEKWNEQFENMKAQQLFSKFQQIIDSVYTKGGLTSQRLPSGVRTRIVDADILAFADTAGLISISQMSSPSMMDERISLTDKGKYFVANYLGQGV